MTTPLPSRLRVLVWKMPEGIEVELEVTVWVDHGVAGIVPAAVADHQPRISREVVDDPALPLVAPLGSHDGDHGHGRARTSRWGWSSVS